MENNDFNPSEYFGYGKDGEEIGDINKFVNKGVNTPPKLKKGEYAFCQMCGKKILPSQLSKNKDVARRQLKWRVHNECWYNSFDMCDRGTPGLLSERKDFYELYNANDKKNRS